MFQDSIPVVLHSQRLHSKIPLGKLRLGTMVNAAVVKVEAYSYPLDNRNLLDMVHYPLELLNQMDRRIHSGMFEDGRNS